VCGEVLGHVAVDDPPAVVSEHDEDEEDAEVRGGHGEEVDRDQVADVVGEERPPGLRGPWAALRQEAGDGALGDVDAELEELAVDAGRLSLAKTRPADKWLIFQLGSADNLVS
jgi:hypothetical protein